MINNPVRVFNERRTDIRPPTPSAIGLILSISPEGCLRADSVHISTLKYGSNQLKCQKNSSKIVYFEWNIKTSPSLTVVQPHPTYILQLTIHSTDDDPLKKKKNEKLISIAFWAIQLNYVHQQYSSLPHRVWISSFQTLCKNKYINTNQKKNLFFLNFRLQVAHFNCVKYALKMTRTFVLNPAAIYCVHHA